MALLLLKPLHNFPTETIYQKTFPTDSLKWTKSEMKSNYSEISATMMVLIGRDA